MNPWTILGWIWVVLTVLALMPVAVALICALWLGVVRRVRKAQARLRKAGAP